MGDGAEAEPGFDFRPVAGHRATSLRQGIIFHSPTRLLAKIRGARRDTEAAPGLAGSGDQELQDRERKPRPKAVTSPGAGAVAALPTAVRPSVGRWSTRR